MTFFHDIWLPPQQSPDIDMGPFGDIGDIGTKETSIYTFCETVKTKL